MCRGQSARGAERRRLQVGRTVPRGGEHAALGRRVRGTWLWGDGDGDAVGSPGRPPGALLLHVALQEEDDGGVALGRLLELLQGDLVVLVLVHLLEDLVDALLGCQPVLVHPHHDDSSHHLVNGLRQGGQRGGE